MLYVVLM